MLSVLVIWIYVLITTFAAGFLVLTAAEHYLDYKTDSLFVYTLSGLSSVIVYSQIYSLFSGVGLWANIILCAGLGIFIICARERFVKQLNEVVCRLKTSKYGLVAGTVLIILFAYGTSHGIMHYDTGLYHAQAIRWIEEYGVVKGLGNLHCRLGYNSAAFPVTALYSFAFLTGRSFHVIAGYCALLLGIECLKLNRVFVDRRLSTSAFARLMGVYYLFMIFDEMVSPASDYYMVTLAFILFIRLIDCFDSEEVSVNVVAMLAYLACVILTIKLSGAFLVLCAIYPAVLFVRYKEFKKLIVSLITGVIIIVPYLVRNIVISGWLLYPSTSFDVFNVDWKIPIGAAQYDFKEIQVYGRGYTDANCYDYPMTRWFPNWFASQSALDRLFILAAIGATVYFVVKCFYYGFSLCKNKNVRKLGLSMVTEALLVVCFSFWLCTSPLMRYGCLFVYLTASVIWGRALIELIKNKYIMWVIYVGLALFAIYKTGMFGKELAESATAKYLLVQQDYDVFETDTYDIDGVTIYKPVEGDRTGYRDFPSSPWEMDNISLRGESLKDGFVCNE